LGRESCEAFCFVFIREEFGGVSSERGGRERTKKKRGKRGGRGNG